MLNNISNNMDAMLNALQPQEKEIKKLSNVEHYLANKETEKDSTPLTDSATEEDPTYPEDDMDMSGAGGPDDDQR